MCSRAVTVAIASHGQIPIKYTYVIHKLPDIRYTTRKIATKAPTRAELDTKEAIRGQGIIRMIENTEWKNGSSDPNDNTNIKLGTYTDICDKYTKPYHTFQNTCKHLHRTRSSVCDVSSLMNITIIFRFSKSV